jgi:hypothetical protein
MKKICRAKYLYDNRWPMLNSATPYGPHKLHADRKTEGLVLCRRAMGIAFTAPVHCHLAQ